MRTTAPQRGARYLLASLALVLGCHWLRAARHAPEPPAGPATTEELIAFVDRAAAELGAKGTAASGEFDRGGSGGKHGARSVFVFDADRNRALFHGHARPTVDRDWAPH